MLTLRDLLYCARIFLSNRYCITLLKGFFRAQQWVYKRNSGAQQAVLLVLARLWLETLAPAEALYREEWPHISRDSRLEPSEPAQLCSVHVMYQNKSKRHTSISRREKGITPNLPPRTRFTTVALQPHECIASLPREISLLKE